MRRILLTAFLLGPLAGCTYVNETQPSRAQQGYGYGTAPSATYGARDSYEAERQAYESGRRDGAAASQGLR